MVKFIDGFLYLTQCLKYPMYIYSIYSTLKAGTFYPDLVNEDTERARNLSTVTAGVRGRAGVCVWTVWLWVNHYSTTPVIPRCFYLGALGDSSYYFSPPEYARWSGKFPNYRVD